MLRELNVVEQRYQAVLEVLDGTPVTEVAQRFGVARQTVHRWVGRRGHPGVSRSTVYRVLVRHRMIEPVSRRRRQIR